MRNRATKYRQIAMFCLITFGAPLLVVPCRAGNVDQKQSLSPDSKQLVSAAGAKDVSNRQTKMFPEPEFDIGPISIESTFDTTKKLKLESLLSIVDNNFPGLMAADAERRIATAKRLETQGAFDPTLTSVNEYLRVQDIVNAGVGKNAVHNEPQLSLLTRSGVKLYGRVRYNPNDAKTPFLPTGLGGEYSGGGTVPLARGLGINEATAAERQAKIGEPLAAQNYKTVRLNMMFEAAAAYWDWMAAAKKIDIAQEILQIAERRAEFVKEGTALGDLPHIDYAEAQQEVQRRKGDLFKMQREFQKSTFKLGLFVWSPSAGDRSPLPTLANVPDKLPVPTDISAIDSTRAIELAMNDRPELKAIKYQQDIASVELRLARNMLLPTVNANFYNGADTGRNGIGFVTKGSVEFNFPLRMRNARGKTQSAQIKLEKISYEQRLLKQRVELQVMDAMSNLAALYERYLAAVQEVEQSRILEKGEQDRYYLGDSTLFVVNRRERDRAEAENKLVDVQSEYWQAVAGLRAATAQL